MNLTQKLRQVMAEWGYEKTIPEARACLKVLKKIWNGISYERYMRYKALDDADIREMAAATGYTYEYAKEQIEMQVYIGDFKFGEEGAE